jgi:ABC-type Fe3+-hydroxamate transport system substrate-binding protein
MILQSVSELHFLPKRIVSLVPSQTELLAYLGLDVETVGITKFCIHPAGWKNARAVIGGTKNLDIRKIHLLKPDLIIANKEENEKTQVEMLAKDYPVWVTDVNDLGTALLMIRDVGRLTGKSESAERLASEIAGAFSQLGTPTRFIDTVYLIWNDPLMTVGGDNFINDMLKRCGFKNMFAGYQRYPQVSIDSLTALEPQLLLLSSEPFPFKQAHAEKLQVDLPETKICLVDGEYFSWYGSRLLLAPIYFKNVLASMGLIET